MNMYLSMIGGVTYEYVFIYDRGSMNMYLSMIG